MDGSKGIEFMGDGGSVCVCVYVEGERVVDRIRTEEACSITSKICYVVYD